MGSLIATSIPSSKTQIKTIPLKKRHSLANPEITPREIKGPFSGKTGCVATEANAVPPTQRARPREGKCTEVTEGTLATVVTLLSSVHPDAAQKNRHGGMNKRKANSQEKRPIIFPFLPRIENLARLNLAHTMGANNPLRLQVDRTQCVAQTHTVSKGNPEDPAAQASYSVNTPIALNHP